jgi:catechol 2,3-dioxygenase
MAGDAFVTPTLHHVNFKTTRLAEMREWYRLVLGAEVVFENEIGCWLTNDDANHRVGLLAFPGFSDDARKDEHTGLHHTAFEYPDFDSLDRSYRRLRDAGVTPPFCLDHGPTLSYYYADPDGNHVELQMDAFGDWAWSKAWMKNSPDFKADPIGRFVDPAAVAADHAAGMAFEEIHGKAMGGGYAPQQQQVAVPEPSA